VTWTVAPPVAGLPACRLDLAGDLSASDVAAAMSACMDLCVEHDTWLVLTDATAMTGGHTVLDIYPLVAALAGLGVQDRFREAIVSPEEGAAAGNVRFWEDAAVNRGLSCATFPTEAEARDWLLA
jgi:hypothetical protein